MKTLEITEQEAIVLLKYMEAQKELIDTFCPKEDNILEVVIDGKNTSIPIISSYVLRKKLEEFVGVSNENDQD